MNFPKKYKCLNTAFFKKEQFELVPIRYEDRIAIMNWRNEQIYHLRQHKKLTAEDQENYFVHIVSKLFEEEQPGQLLFSFLKNGTCVGYGGLVHINWVDKHAEISFIMATELEKENFAHYWGEYLSIISEVAFNHLKLHKIFTYAYDIRPLLYPVLEAQGFNKEAVLKDHCLFQGEFKDVVIHSKISNNRYQIDFKRMSKDHLKLVYDWSNETEARSNSFNSSEIPFNDHDQWFNQKLLDKSALYLIGNVNEEPACFIRFDVKNDHALVGINIDKKFRGKGLSATILKKATEEYFKLNSVKLVACIKKQNIASVKAFEKAEFKLGKNTMINGAEAYEYYLEK